MSVHTIVHRCGPSSRVTPGARRDARVGPEPFVPPATTHGDLTVVGPVEPPSRGCPQAVGKSATNVGTVSAWHPDHRARIRDHGQFCWICRAPVVRRPLAAVTGRVSRFDPVSPRALPWYCRSGCCPGWRPLPHADALRRRTVVADRPAGLPHQHDVAGAPAPDSARSLAPPRFGAVR